MDALCSASRRTSDPGIIELQSVSIPMGRPETFSLLRSNADMGPCTSPDGRNSVPHGEVLLQCFEESRTRKKRRLEYLQKCAFRQMVSVRINSSSSRSRVISNTDKAKSISVTLPLEVQNGRFLSSTKANKMSRELGSYDWRHGLGQTNHSGKNSNRISVGRTRVMWSEKSHADQPQKVFFKSLLSGSRLESGAQKRPREIDLLIKVDGSHVRAEEVVGSQENETIRPDPQVPENAKCNSKEFIHPNMQIRLDVSKLLKSTSAEAREAQVYGKTKQATTGNIQVGRKEAKLQCLPDTTGVLSVACTDPGCLTSGSVHELLNRKSRLKGGLCTVCWGGDGEVTTCTTCGLVVHPRCCHHRGVSSTITSGDRIITQWRCAVCHFHQTNGDAEQISFSEVDVNRSRRRKSAPPHWLKDSHVEYLSSTTIGQNGGACREHIKCFLCPFSGGAMSPVIHDGERYWVHEVCRIWAGNSIQTKKPPHQCVLCGLSSTRGLTRCAADGCQVLFHPMCVHVSGLDTHDPLLKKNGCEQEQLQLLKDDRIRRSLFYLGAVDCEGAAVNSEKAPAFRSLLTMPVAFCGIHNPRREYSVYGLPDVALEPIQSSVRLPLFGESCTFVSPCKDS